MAADPKGGKPGEEKSKGRIGHALGRRTVLGGMLAMATGAVATSSEDVAGSSGVGLVSESDATHRAVESGAWQDAAIWADGIVPGDGARVLLEEGVTVTLSGRTARLEWLRVDGSVIFDPNTDTHLETGTLVTTPGSRLQIGTAEIPIHRDVDARITFLDHGPIDETDDPDRVSRGLIVNGEFTIHGASKTPWSKLARPPTAGDSQVELPETPTNWQAGDRIVVPGVTPNDDQDEERVIESVDGGIVSFASPLEYDHVPPKTELDSYVLNLSRNVVLTSESTETNRRGHVMIMSTATDVRYAAFEDLGRTDKAKVITNPVRNEDALSGDEDVNPAARYPFHYHHTGIEADPHYVEGIVATGSPGWGIVNHHAHADVTDSITYDVRGAGFVAEGGNERGSFDNCIAVRSEGSGETIDSRSAGAHGGDPPIDDFGHAGHGFWLQSPLVEITNCVAAGHRHQAFVWWLRPLLDGTLAEGTSINDSRVTYHPNLPMEYLENQEPLLGAIDQGRFANGRNNDVMRETGKVPSTFANIKRIRGNVAFASAGGADFSRHNFKWKHERFSDFNVVEEMTVHSIGPFVDGDGEVHEPDLPRHLASGHQGRGGNVGVSFRYTSNVSLTNAHLVGGDRANSVAVPWHDYLWTNTVDDSTIENWDWGISTGEHRLTWVRNNTFRRNNYDVEWNFDNVGPAVLDDNDLVLARNEFQYQNQKATEVFQFGRGRGMRIDGRSAHVEASDPDFVPFPDEESLSGINGLEEVFDDPSETVGMTNAALMDEYGVAISGALLPDDAVEASYIDGSMLDPTERNPPSAVYLDSVNADSLGMFEVVAEPDTAGGECLRSTESDAPTDNPASISFECAAGTYEVHYRLRPDSWNGDDLHYRIDGGDWYTAEKLKSPVGFEWHDASPNNEPAYEHELSEGTHTLEFACGNDGVLVDEIFVGSDSAVLGAYGMSQESDGETAPSVDSLSVSEVESDSSSAEFDAAWSVSDVDDDLESVELTLYETTGDGDRIEAEDVVTEPVSGDTASGTTRLVADGDDGTGNNYTLEVTVTDTLDNAASVTADIEADESDSQEPYTDHDLSRIEAEDFDVGGEGVAYHDTTQGNEGGAYRDTDVDIQATDDAEGAYNIGWIRDGEWLEYTVDLPEDGEYGLRARLAGMNATTLDFLVDGSKVATADVPDTGGWQEWTTVDVGTVTLAAGTHVIRLEANGRDFNINWFGFQEQTSDDPPAVTTDPAASVGETSVTLNGSLDELGGADAVDVSFEWRQTGSDTWNATEAETLSGTAPFSQELSHLSGDTDYEYRAVAEAIDGDSDTGEAVSFSTAVGGDDAPVIEDYRVTEAGSPNPHAEITAEWRVSDADSDLEGVSVRVFDSVGRLVDSESTDVSGSTAGGDAAFKIKHAPGRSFDVTLSVTDTAGNSVDDTQTVTER